MKPFLLLSIRREPEAAEDEYASFLRFSGLEEAELPLVNVAVEEVPEVDLEDWSGIVLGGGPWNASDPESTKAPEQRRAERSLSALLDRVVEADFPFLGACYGVGTLGTHQGGLVDRRWPEAVGPLTVTLTEEGAADPVLAGLPTTFAAYGGHKEALSRVPPGVTVLATSPACPVQAFRVGRHVYATQFHPELDVEGVCTRIEVYQHAGYFPPADTALMQQRARAVEVVHPMRVLRQFVELHAR